MLLRLRAHEKTSSKIPARPLKFFLHFEHYTDPSLIVSKLSLLLHKPKLLFPYTFARNIDWNTLMNTTTRGLSRPIRDFQRTPSKINIESLLPSEVFRIAHVEFESFLQSTS